MGGMRFLVIFLALSTVSCPMLGQAGELITSSKDAPQKEDVPPKAKESKKPGSSQVMPLSKDPYRSSVANRIKEGDLEKYRLKQDSPKQEVSE